MTAPRIPEEWRQFAVPLDQLKLYPGNAKLHDLPTIKASLKLRGQYRMAVVQRSTSYVCVGNGMLVAARELGWTELAVHYRDLNEHEARDLVLVDNRSTELGGYDTDALIALLQAQPTLEHTGYDTGALEELLAASAPPEPTPRGDGRLLALADVAVGEPTHQPQPDEVWHLGDGPHVLVVAAVHTGWAAWVKQLKAGMLLLPYPSPYAPLAEVAAATRLLLVQPDTYLAGHLLDKYAAVHGADSVRRAA